MKKQQTTSFEWNSVTPLSKVLAAILFISLPFVAFFWGMSLQQRLDEPVMASLDQSASYTGTTMKAKPGLTTSVKPVQTTRK